MRRLMAIFVPVFLCAYQASAQFNPTLIGTWVQDETGPAVIHRRSYVFKPDGTYTFALTSRPRGSNEQKTLMRERGTFRVEGDRLTIRPRSGAARVVGWRVEKDPYAGDLKLVFTKADGNLDIYFPE